ncbi:adenylate/guanylate cyclase domain-containing protein [Nocardioides mangrovi]|uniref:Adenylate/guanylate cyclase domain-containing protein n=1 Tax=Nocardioides mangrovi TaxID=2874580 RepID=A0ABS7UIN0_9ACTN|nr:adenylate/guanylate cyclase domain-containing protein [Nocardioides mangrovi]MBZ5740889.1 adenylate/guanylate cyclase domain-containing protein [Nocardioides mangrovi]
MTGSDPVEDGPAGDLPGPDDLERAILGQTPAFNAQDVVERTGVTIDEARRLWRALGFPEHGLEAAYTDADTEALATLVGVVRSGMIDFDLGVNLTRAVGQTMARLADWEVSTLLHRVDEMADDAASGGDTEAGRTGSALRLIGEMNGPFEDLLIYVWRRHLAAAVARVEALRANEDDLNTVPLTVGFADIVSFTALSNTLAEDRIGDLVELFESRCADVVATQRGRVIKSIGDSVLFVSDDPVGAYAIAEGIINVVGRDPRMPDVRLGLASGSVVMRLGDVFGPPVNLAARLTAVARRNRIIIDAATAQLLPADQFETRRLPARPVRGFGIVEPVAVRRT